jgi:hypothetical protein
MGDKVPREIKIPEGMIPVMIGVNEISDLPMLLNFLFPPPSLIRSLRGIDHHHPLTRNYEAGIAPQEFSFHEDIFFDSFHRVVPCSFLAQESDFHADLIRFSNGIQYLLGGFAVPDAVKQADIADQRASGAPFKLFLPPSGSAIPSSYSAGSCLVPGE